MNEDATQNLRRLTLRAWLNINGGTRQACLRKGLGRSMESHISQILRGYSFGARAARNIEMKLGIPNRHLEVVPVDLDEASLKLLTQMNPKDAQASKFLMEMTTVRDVVTIPQYPVGSALSERLVLRHQSGSVTSISVTKDWLAQNVKGCSEDTDLCVITGFGDSMTPLFRTGDPLLLDRAVNKFVADAVYFFRIAGEGYINRLQNIPGEGYRVLSSNTAYEAWTITPEMDFQILGRVVKAWNSQNFSQ